MFNFLYVSVYIHQGVMFIYLVSELTSNLLLHRLYQIKTNSRDVRKEFEVEIKEELGKMKIFMKYI